MLSRRPGRETPPSHASFQQRGFKLQKRGQKLIRFDNVTPTVILHRASTSSSSIMATTIIEVRPHRGGWQVFEAPGVQPFFIERDAKRMAVDYATARMKSRRGEIRVLDAAGAVTETIQFSDTHRPV